MRNLFRHFSPNSEDTARLVGPDPFEDFVAEYCAPFVPQGRFALERGQGMSQVARSIPDLPGVYMIYSGEGEYEYLQYIGKSGTLMNDGKFKDQMLRERLVKGKQDGQPRYIYFPNYLATHPNVEVLVFYWYVAFSDTNRIIPAKAESDLLQAYFEVYGCLPPWNKSM